MPPKKKAIKQAKKDQEPITNSTRLLEPHTPAQFYGTPRGGHFRNFQPTGNYAGHSHFGKYSHRVVVLPTAFGKTYEKDLETFKRQREDEGKPLTRRDIQNWVRGRWKTVIDHHENKGKAYQLLIERSKPFLTAKERASGVGIKGVRIMPATFVEQFAIEGGKQKRHGDKRPLSETARQPSYGHKREYLPDALSLSALMEGVNPKNMFQWLDKNSHLSAEEREYAKAAMIQNIFGDMDVSKGVTPDLANEILDDLYDSFNWMHNKHQIAHNDAHARNIRIYHGKPHLEDFGQFVDLRATEPQEVGIAIGHDLALLSMNFAGVLPARELADRMNSHITNLNYGLGVKVVAKDAIKAYARKKQYKDLKPIADLL
jgi:hypothetical protein